MGGRLRHRGDAHPPTSHNSIPYYIIPCTINSIIKTYVITLVVHPPIVINYNATKPAQDDDENDDDDHDYDDHDHDYDGSGEDG